MSWKESFKEKLEGRSTGRFLTLIAGINIFRPLPNYYWQMSNEPDDNPTAVEYLKHRDVGPKAAMCTCGKYFNDEGEIEGECYLCDVVIPKLLGGSPKEVERAEKMKAVPFTLMQVSPVINGRFQEPKILELQVGGAKSWGSKVMGILLRADKFYEHPTKGKNIVIHKHVEPGKSAMKGTTYPVIEVEEEVTKVPKAIFDMRKPLEDLLPVYDIEEVKAALRGQEYKRNREDGDNWDVGGGGYDETKGANVQEDGSSYEAAPYDDQGYPYDDREANGGYYDAEGNWIEYDAEAEAASAGEGWEEAAADAAGEADGAGWGEGEGEVAAAEEWGEAAPAAEETGWGDEPEAPVKKGAPAKKGALPPPVKQTAPVKKGTPPAKKQAPPPPPPPAKKMAPPPPPPPVKKGIPTSLPPVKKGGGAPPPVKKGMPPAKKGR